MGSQFKKSKNCSKWIPCHLGYLHPLYSFRESKIRMIFYLRNKATQKKRAHARFLFYHLLVNDNSRLAYLHLSRLKTPAAMRPSPSKTNHTQGGVYTITSRIPTKISKTDKTFHFLCGLWGLYGLCGLLPFHTNIVLPLPGHSHYVSILLHTIHKAWKGY